MSLTFHTMDEASARAMLTWHYKAPYDLYDLDSGDSGALVRFFVDQQNAYYAILDEGRDLVAYCCFGLDAQVPGGDYREPALDIGLGVRPDLTGQGNGLTYVNAVLRFAQRSFAPERLRVTVAEFNARARKVWERAGFQSAQTFDRLLDDRPFLILTKYGTASPFREKTDDE